MSRFGSFGQSEHATFFWEEKEAGSVRVLWLTSFEDNPSTCFTASHDQNMSISLRCSTANPLRVVSETYLHLSLRRGALNRQVISLSHFRLRFFGLISDTYCQNKPDDRSFEQQLPCSVEHLSHPSRRITSVYLSVQI